MPLIRAILAAYLAVSVLKPVDIWEVGTVPPVLGVEPWVISTHLPCPAGRQV